MPDPKDMSFLNPDGTLHQRCVEGLLTACIKATERVPAGHQKSFFQDLTRALEELLRHRAVAKEAVGKTPG